jgi:phosphoserine phosphatase RsbU/P
MSMKLSENQSRVFVCDDQMEVREALRLLLKSNGYVVETFGGPEELLAAAMSKPVQLILVDMNYTRDTTSGGEGLELIGKLQEARVGAPVIAMTAWGDIALAVQAMQRGASDFMEKPWSNERLLQMAAKWIAAKPAGNREMEGARRVQQSLLPQGGGAQGGERGRLQYACRFLPAREVSGDYYDFFEKKVGHFSFAMADVSGKGVPAAMLMANLQGLFRSHVQREDGIGAAELLGLVNQQFYESTAPESFATAFYGDFDEASGELRYVNAGHPPVLLRRASGKVETLEATAMVIGAFAGWQAETQSVRLEAGDRLLVYSDGAVEAQSAAAEEFGEERLLDLFLSSAGERPAEALAGIEAAIQRHSGLHLFDDCTLFLLEPQSVGH